MTVQVLMCLQDWRRVDYDTTPKVDNDFNLDEEGGYEDEEDDIGILLDN